MKLAQRVAEWLGAAAVGALLAWTAAHWQSSGMRGAPGQAVPAGTPLAEADADVFPHLRLPPQESRELFAAISRWETDQAGERQQAMQWLQASQRSYVRTLLRLAIGQEEPNGDVNADFGPSPRTCAIRLLASMGSRDAIPVFVESIEFFEGGFRGPYDPLEGFECVKALSTYGPLAAMEIQRYLIRTPPENLSPQEIDLFAKTIIRCYGSADVGGPNEALVDMRRLVNRPAHRDPRIEGGLKPVLAAMETQIQRMYPDGPPAGEPAVEAEPQLNDRTNGD
jgi:hypothetical protein